MSSSTAKQCAICETLLNQKGIEEITTACGHTFHRECTQKRIDKYKKTKCKICGKEGVLADALKKDIMITTSTAADTRNDLRPKYVEDVSYLGMTVMINVIKID